MTGISEGSRPDLEPEPPRGSPDGGPDWPVDFDPDALLAAAVRSSASSEADQEAILAAELESREQEDDRWAGPAGSPDRPPRAGEVAEALAAGPGLAAWLARQEPAALTDWDLPAVAAACRKLASWAQARELATVSQIAVRSAGEDDRIGLADDGRPAHVSADAAAQVSLGLTLSPYGGEAWTHLAVTLQWRLARTGRALAEGAVDLYRARVIADATVLLSEEAARAVENAVLARAGELTYGQLHAAVRRAVIAADPEGAERRRQAAERQSKVSLYPDQDCTAALGGTRLPAGHAAAAMARICAMAQALKASGAGGGIDLLRARVFLGLLLGTLPLIPPPADGPPGSEPPPDDHDGAAPRDDSPVGDGSPAADSDPAADGRGLADRDPAADRSPETTSPETDRSPETTSPVTDVDLPDDDGYLDSGPALPDSYSRWDSADGGPPGGDCASQDAVPAWPPVPPSVPAAPAAYGPAAAGRGSRTAATGRPPPDGLLDLMLPWAALTGEGSEPGRLGRIGPVTAPQARELARLAARDRRSQWRVILTDAGHHAIAVARIPREHPPPDSGPPDGTGGTGVTGVTGVVGRLTVILTACMAAEQRYALRSTAPADRTAGRRPTRADEKAARRGLDEAPRITLRRQVTTAAASASSEQEFFARLDAAGLLVRKRFSVKNPGQVTGHSAALPGDTTKDGGPVWYGGAQNSGRDARMCAYGVPRPDTAATGSAACHAAQVTVGPVAENDDPGAAGASAISTYDSPVLRSSSTRGITRVVCRWYTSYRPFAPGCMIGARPMLWRLTRGHSRSRSSAEATEARAENLFQPIWTSTPGWDWRFSSQDGG